MSTFLFYKYNSFNYGIGYYDSFPSVQKIEMKKDIKWNYNKNKYLACKKIILNFNKWDYYNPNSIPDRFKSIYLTVHLLNDDYEFESNFTLIKNSIKNDKIFKISDL